MKPHRAIVLDEDPAVADVIAKMIRSAGHEAVVAGDESLAIEVATELLPTIAFIDLDMRDAAPWNSASELKRSASNVVLVGLTTQLREDFVEWAAGAGFHSVLSKPFSLADLNRVMDIYALLQRPSLPHEG